MKRVAVLCGLMFWAGLSAAPRQTVASKDETLAILCARFEAGPAHDMRFHARLAEQMRHNGDFDAQLATLSLVRSLEAVGKMVCISGPRAR